MGENSRRKLSYDIINGCFINQWFMGRDDARLYEKNNWRVRWDLAEIQLIFSPFKGVGTLLLYRPDWNTDDRTLNGEYLRWSSLEKEKFTKTPMAKFWRYLVWWLKNGINEGTDLKIQETKFFKEKPIMLQSIPFRLYFVFKSRIF